MSHITQTASASIIGNVATAIGSGMKKHFTKIAIAAVLVGLIGAVAYALKKSGLFKKNIIAGPSFTKDGVAERFPKDSAQIIPLMLTPSIHLSEQDKLDEEIKSICKNKECDPDNIVGMLEADYKKITNYLEKCSQYKVIVALREILNENVTVSDSGNVFFVGEKAVEAYAKAVAASGYIKNHPANGWHPTRLMLIRSDHPSFSHYDKVAGPPIPLLEKGHIINFKDINQYAAEEAIKYIGKDAEWFWSNQANFKTFKNEIPKDLKFKLVEEIGDELFIAVEKEVKKHISWLKTSKAKKFLGKKKLIESVGLRLPN